jgi:hypothetical protein
MADSEFTPKFAPFLGMGGIAFAMIFGCTDYPRKSQSYSERILRSHRCWSGIWYSQVRHWYRKRGNIQT